VSAVGLVAGVIVGFFIVGIGAGVIAMMALSALKYRRRVPRDDRRAGRRSGRRSRRFGRAGDEVGWQEPPGPGACDGGDGGYGNEPTRWTGG